MKVSNTEYKIISYCLAAIWLINGLFCKLLNLVPRHREIVARILGDDNAKFFTHIIGVAETLMAAWILNGKWSKQNAIIQIVVIAIMNLIEFILAPDLLLWGKWNALFAFLLILFIYWKEFILQKNFTKKINATIS